MCIRDSPRWAYRRDSIQLPERRESANSSPTLGKTPSPRDGAILEKAARMKEEELEEVRRLNELILAAKCHTILDNQVIFGI